MRNALAFVLLFLAGGVFAQSTVVQGHVLDGETNKPLPGATVFIANSTYGLMTGADGEFMIKGLARAHYKLVISFVGYETQTFDVVPGQPVTYKVVLKPSAQKLNEIVIQSNSKRSHSEWLANFKLFQERFIGLSENSKLCSFENSQVLSFDNQDGLLKAYADSTLVVVNKGLGYRISVLLGKYEYNLINRILYYEGQIVYEPITPPNEEVRLRWAKNRLKAYYGSEMHFLRSLYERCLIEEGFYFNIINKVATEYEGAQRIGMADTTILTRSTIFKNKTIRIRTLYKYKHLLDSATSTPEEPVLLYKGDLEIQYVHEGEPGTYQQARRIFPGKSFQRSTMILLKKCVVDQLGQVYPNDAIESKNYWTWELMAESLPLNYIPENDLAIVRQKKQKP